jgi:septum formation protein
LVLTLASTSAIRRMMLEQAGLTFDSLSPNLDEAAEKRKHSDASTLTRALAEAKALTISRDRPGDWVIGSDSAVSIGNRIYDKPKDRDEATRHLREFSGKEMVLTSAVALAKGGHLDWSGTDSAVLAVRHLSDDFIRDYLDAEWPEVSYCVGVFRLEGRGVQLFDRIDGNYFTILGMPLLPLLGALRDRGVISR